MTSTKDVLESKKPFPGCLLSMSGVVDVYVKITEVAQLAIHFLTTTLATAVSSCFNGGLMVESSLFNNASSYISGKVIDVELLYRPGKVRCRFSWMLVRSRL